MLANPGTTFCNQSRFCYRRILSASSIIPHTRTEDYPFPGHEARVFASYIQSPSVMLKSCVCFVNLSMHVSPQYPQDTYNIFHRAFTTTKKNSPTVSANVPKTNELPPIGRDDFALPPGVLWNQRRQRCCCCVDELDHFQRQFTSSRPSLPSASTLVSPLPARRSVESEEDKQESFRFLCTCQRRGMHGRS